MILVERDSMLSASYRTTGIKDVVIWFGNVECFDYKFINVSNILNDLFGLDCFKLTIPDFNIIGDINKNVITDEILDRLKIFINKNIETINLYYSGKLSDSEFSKIIGNYD